MVNGDDEHVRWMATQTSAWVVTFGFDEGNDVRARDVRDEGAGVTFTAEIGGTAMPVRTRLLGEHMAYAVLAALAVAWVEGLPLAPVVAHLAAMEPPSGRLHVLHVANDVTVVDDSFKAGYESVTSSLDSFARVPATRHLLLFGGIEDPEGSAGPLYRSLGDRLARLDRSILVGSRQLRTAIAGAVDTGADRSTFAFVGSDLYGALRLLRDELVPGDALLVKGGWSQRLERVVLALAGRDVRCPAKICQIPNSLRCDACPLLGRDDVRIFENVFVRRFVSLESR